MASASLPFLDELTQTTARPSRARPDVLAATALLGADFDRAFRVAIEEEGTLGEALHHHFRVSGDLSRARLGLDAGDALGLDRSVAVPFAVACELLYNASVIHDDLRDREAVRRGQPSVWARFGEELAANVEDFLLTKAFEVAAAAPVDPSCALDVLKAFTHATTAVVHAQIAEDALVESEVFDLRRLQEIARKKAGPLIALPVHAALAAAGRAEHDGDSVTAAFELFGIVDQIQDDVADVMPRKGRAAARDLRTARSNIVVGLHRELVDEHVMLRLEAARALLHSRPDHLESLLLELSISPALDHAFFFADRIVGVARVRAEMLPTELQPVFDRSASRLTAPLEQLRKLDRQTRKTIAVEIESHRRSEAVPVHA